MKKEILYKARIESFGVVTSKDKYRKELILADGIVPSKETPLQLFKATQTLHFVTVVVTGFHMDGKDVIDSNGNRYSNDEFGSRLSVYAARDFEDKEDKGYATFKKGDELRFQYKTHDFYDSYLVGEDGKMVLLFQLEHTNPNAKTMSIFHDAHIGIDPIYAETLTCEDFDVVLEGSEKYESKGMVCDYVKNEKGKIKKITPCRMTRLEMEDNTIKSVFVRVSGFHPEGNTVVAENGCRYDFKEFSKRLHFHTITGFWYPEDGKYATFEQWERIPYCLVEPKYFDADIRYTINDYFDNDNNLYVRLDLVKNKKGINICYADNEILACDRFSCGVVETNETPCQPKPTVKGGETIVAREKIEEILFLDENGKYSPIHPSATTPLPIDEKTKSLREFYLSVSGYSYDDEHIIDCNGRKYMPNEFFYGLQVYAISNFIDEENKGYVTIKNGDRLSSVVKLPFLTERHPKDFFNEDNKIVIYVLVSENRAFNGSDKVQSIGISPVYATSLSVNDFELRFEPNSLIKGVEYLTPSEAAKELGVTVDCLRKWDVSGRLKPDLVTEGGHRRYLKERIDEITKVNTEVSKTLCYRGLDYEIDEIKHVKTYSLTNGEMIWLDGLFSEYPDKKHYIKVGDAWKCKKENTSCYNNISNQIIEDGLEIVEEYFKECGGIEKYGKQHYDDFKIMWRLLVTDSHNFWEDLEKGRIELVMDTFRNVLNSYNFMPLFRAYKTNASMNDYGVYRLMMDEFRLEVMSDIEMMINEYDKKCYMEVYEELKNDTITQFENLDYNVLRIIYGLWNVDFYIEDFVLPENRKYLEIQVKDKDIFEKMCEKFHNYRRKTYYNHYSTCNVPCIDDYLRDWFF